jgi:hypothetical protein
LLRPEEPPLVDGLGTLVPLLSEEPVDEPGFDEGLLAELPDEPFSEEPDEEPLFMEEPLDESPVALPVPAPPEPPVPALDPPAPLAPPAPPAAARRVSPAGLAALTPETGRVTRAIPASK